MIHESQIRQNGKVFLSGDRNSIHMVFKNMTGVNFSGAEYAQYKKYIESQGADLSTSVELYDNGVWVDTGRIV